MVDAAHPPQIAEMERLSKWLQCVCRAIFRTSTWKRWEGSQTLRRRAPLGEPRYVRAAGVLVSGPQLADFMSDPLTTPPQPPEDEFANVRARAGRHPALALGAAALAL